MVQIDNQLLQLAYKACEDKKAENIVVLDIHTISVMADRFIICHGNNERQVQAIVREIRDQVHKNGYNIRGIEGEEQGRWVLVDCGDVVVHVFHKEERDFYNLEKLWSDAPRVTVEV
ncbi:ribosome silencing factor [Brevibacillus laterosporus]|uniref:Ribosomal silencing factor RsfS n=2 Tax=Brevibacillus TaxID=55080 RepID=A0A0F7EIN5_BRELA|nr:MULTISPECIES: ribosome silencing factor [Brevibacillus]AKF95030.1 iojap [Brevibacillus laterosporus]MCR8986333.1 ribosome silencing factor [Brevibacillus laterosporus]MCZ0832067.1 ribosome silencing factor [Brevibacillus halotolerans]MDN9010877.1 ribosome silencing factor [Brevibacillus laterosporus]MDO0941900.1 ribosome silencing factor [Brevibacillus laterosporus]